MVPTFEIAEHVLLYPGYAASGRRHASTSSEPGWWLNLQAHPNIRVDLADGPRLVAGRAADSEERDRLWARWREIDPELDGYAARRCTETAVVILEPQAGERYGRVPPVTRTTTLPAGSRRACRFNRARHWQVDGGSWPDFLPCASLSWRDVAAGVRIGIWDEYR